MDQRLPRKLAAILYADVAGYSRLTGEDEDATHLVLRSHLDFITSTIQSHSGRVVHYAGDAVLADFGTVLDALTCAMVIQDELKKRNEEFSEERKVQFRIGVNLGDVIVDQDEIYGDGVNVAARLESLAEPGGICISEAVRVAVGNKLPLDYFDMGNQRVKNIERLVRAYRSQSRQEETATGSKQRHASMSTTKPHVRKRHTVAVVASIAAIGIAVIVLLSSTDDQSLPASPDRGLESLSTNESSPGRDSEPRSNSDEPILPQSAIEAVENSSQEEQSDSEATGNHAASASTAVGGQAANEAAVKKLLSEEEIRKLLVGNTIDFASPRNGMDMKVYFAADGGVTVKAEYNPNLVTIHTWFFKEGDIFCRTVQSDRRNHCTRVMAGDSADTVDFINAKHGVIYSAKILQGRQLPD